MENTENTVVLEDDVVIVQPEDTEDICVEDETEFQPEDVEEPSIEDPDEIVDITTELYIKHLC